MSIENHTVYSDDAVIPLVNRSMDNTESNQNQTHNSNYNCHRVSVEMSELPRQTSTSQTEDSFANILNSLSGNLKSCKKWSRKRMVDAVYIVSFLLYVVYIGFVINYNLSSAIFSLIDVIIFLLFVVHRFMKLQDIAKRITKPLVIRARRRCCIHPLVQRYFRRGLTTVLYVGLLIFLVIDVQDDVSRWIPLAGLAVFMFILFLTSKSPLRVKWTPVLWGVLLQFILGIVILRWKTGYDICKTIGDLVANFLAFTDYGSKFVFGEKTYTLHVVAFKILPVVVYFSSFVAILYYYGIMQFIIKWLAKIFQYTMNTTAIESFATAAHIFIGALESTVTLKPFYCDLTLSELNAVMTGGFATVAGTVIAAYIEFGIPPEHVISACFMSAPAALAVAKLNWPETETTADIDKDIHLDVGKELNLMEAASNGAVVAIKLVAYVIVNLIAFISLLAFLNFFLSFMGSRVGHPEVTFEFLCSYVFMPLAVIMGVPWKDSRHIGKLIGKKIFINEFLSFADLGVMIKNKEIENRSIVIGTYILCGFGSVAAIGINLGAFSAAEPRRRQDFAKGMVRAMICGNIACFMTACVAGILYQENFVFSLSSNSTVEQGNSTANITQFNNVTV